MAALVGAAGAAIAPFTGHWADPAAHARLNSAFIAMLFVGGAVGSQLGSVVHRAGDWAALTVLGAALPFTAPLYWATERRQQAAAKPGTASL